MKVLATLLASVGLVSAHGYVDNATINGQFYQFYQPYMDPYMGANKPQRISRSIPGNGPVEDVTSLAVQCNADAAPAPLHAQAAAGSTVTLRWTLWPDSHMGPVLTYMARCPDSGCQNWLPGSSCVPPPPPKLYHIFGSHFMTSLTNSRRFEQCCLVQDQGGRPRWYYQQLG